MGAPPRNQILATPLLGVLIAKESYETGPSHIDTSFFSVWFRFLARTRCALAFPRKRLSQGRE